MPKSRSVMDCLLDVLSPRIGQDGGKSSRPGDEGVGPDKWWEINQMDACSPTILKLLSVRYEFLKNDSVVVLRLHLRARGRTVPVTTVTSWVCFMLSFPLCTDLWFVYTCDLLKLLRLRLCEHLHFFCIEWIRIAITEPIFELFLFFVPKKLQSSTSTQSQSQKFN